MIVYKVCRSVGRSHVSAVCEGEATLRYRKGRWTYSKPEMAKRGLHIFCFETYADAFRWRSQGLSHCMKFEVWEAEAGERVPLPDSAPVKVFDKVVPWQAQLLELQGLRRVKLATPPGTIMVKRLKLVRRLV